MRRFLQLELSERRPDYHPILSTSNEGQDDIGMRKPSTIFPDIQDKKHGCAQANCKKLFWLLNNDGAYRLYTFCENDVSLDKSKQNAYNLGRCFLSVRTDGLFRCLLHYILIYLPLPYKEYIQCSHLEFCILYSNSPLSPYIQHPFYNISKNSLVLSIQIYRYIWPFNLFLTTIMFWSSVLSRIYQIYRNTSYFTTFCLPLQHKRIYRIPSKIFCIPYSNNPLFPTILSIASQLLLLSYRKEADYHQNAKHIVG